VLRKLPDGWIRVRRRAWFYEIDYPQRYVQGPSNQAIAEGKKGWKMLWLEGNWYIEPGGIQGNPFRTRPIPGLCFYKRL
jgi:hypothetical protein